MDSVRALFELIWKELHPNEKFAYSKYSEIDEKYKEATRTSLLKNVCVLFEKMIDSIVDFFDSFSCLQNPEKRLKKYKQFKK